MHIRWDCDEYSPNYVPRPGERIFVDLTMEKAREVAKQQLKQLEGTKWECPPEEESARIEELTRSLYGNGHQPDLIVISGVEDWLIEFIRSRSFPGSSRIG